MPNRRPPKSHPLSGLKTLESAPRLLHLGNRKAQLQVLAVAPDVFRIRATSTVSFSTLPSPAIDPVRQVHVEADVQSDAQTASLTTAVGQFRIHLETGAWQVADHGGNLLFSTGQPIQFAGAKTELNLDLASGESVFGLGESTGTFNRRGTVRDFWNIDVLGHAPAIHPALQSLYVSIPFAISLRNGRAAGLFWDNPARQVWDIGQSRLDQWSLTAASGELDLYLFLGPTVAEVTGRFLEWTGRIPMPPRWALGYQQSRYSYETSERLEEVAREFRRRKLPCDALYLDIHHLDGHRVFTFGKGFPKPAEMLTRLARKGFKVVAIVDPGVKDDPKFGVLKRGREADAFVKCADGKTDYIGEVWPGAARFPDFLNTETRTWWGDEQRVLSDLGIAGVWNDMNEPANFARPDKTLPPDSMHRTDQGPRPHVEVHNLYGQEMARASREGLLRLPPKRGRNRRGAAGVPRPFVVTRAGSAGIQRQAIVWTGDTSSHWDHLNDAIQMLLNLSLSGVPVCGGDVGGFLGNTTPELFVRWFQFAAFTPFFRNHSNIGTLDQEPWALGKPVEEICRHYLHLRYQLLPYLYALTAGARETGAPLMRPMLWHFANDPIAVACGDQFLLGPDLLVAPVVRQGAVARSVYLPNDLWYDFWTGEVHPGGRHIVAQAPVEMIPLFVRAGAILPMGEVTPFTANTAPEIVSLQCWPRGRGTLTWYEDDGVSEAYQEGVSCRRTIHSRTQGRTLELQFEPESGSWSSTVKTWRLIFWGARSAGSITLNGKPIQGSFDDEGGVCIAEIPNFPSAMTVRFSGVAS